MAAVLAKRAGNDGIVKQWSSVVLVAQCRTGDDSGGITAAALVDWQAAAAAVSMIECVRLPHQLSVALQTI